MSYEFRKRETKKLKNSKRDKKKQQKETNKQEREKKKLLAPVQITEEEFMTWDDVVIDTTKLSLGCVTAKKGKIFTLLNKDTSEFFEATLCEEVPTSLKGSFVVGDLVYYTKINDKFIVKKRTNRQNYLARTKANSTRYGSWEEKIIAANIDIAVIVMPVKNPKFDAKLTDRYLILCSHWGVTPILCLNKIDLTEDRDPLLVQYSDAGIIVIETSTETQQGINELMLVLKNKVAVLLGKSGVGKSSLVNALHKTKITGTQDIHENSGEGKHTTTTSSMYKWTDNSYIIDTPGVRMLGLDYLEKKNLQYYFDEFAEFQKKCKYKKCLHDHTPVVDCAIKKAVAAKKIPQRRYNSYLRVLKDLV